MSIFFKRNILIALIIVIIVSGTLGILFLLRPSLEKFRLAREDKQLADSEYESAMANLDELKMLRNQLARVDASQIVKLQGLFLSSPELAYLTALLSNHAQASRFLLTSLAITTPTLQQSNKGPLGEVDIQLQLRGGGYRELKEFFKLVSISVPLLDMSSFTFDPKSASVSLNLKAWRIIAPTSTRASDLELLNDPQFRALRAPPALAPLTPVGRENPFAPIEELPTPSNSPSERGRN